MSESETSSMHAANSSNSFLTGWKLYLVCISLLITVLFKFKNPLQFYVKFVVYFVMTITYSFSIIPLLLLRPNNCKNIEWVSLTLGNMLRIFGMSFTLENEHYLQIKQPYILLSNHQSSLDFITLMQPIIWPGGNCTPLAKKELWYSGPFGLAIWLCGITFIDRLHPDRSKNTLKKLAKRVNDENLRVWIYPEGTRSAKPELLPFKKGAFHLAIEAQVPIICMVTSSYANFYSKKERKWNFGGEVKCKVLPPFQTKGMTPDSVNQLAKLMHSKMQKEFDLLNDEIGLEKKYCHQESQSVIEADETQKQEDFDNGFEHLETSSYENEYVDNNESIKECLSDNNNNSINDEEIKKMK